MSPAIAVAVPTARRLQPWIFHSSSETQYCSAPPTLRIKRIKGCFDMRKPYSTVLSARTCVMDQLRIDAFEPAAMPFSISSTYLRCGDRRLRQDRTQRLKHRGKGEASPRDHVLLEQTLFQPTYRSRLPRLCRLPVPQHRVRQNTCHHRGK